jgi:histidinol-phosphatase (PHP family)
MIADYHTHTPLCRHASGKPVEYVQAAIERGLPEIGFADHNPMDTPFDDWRMMIDELPSYISQVEQVREEFPQIQVQIGLECDYIVGMERWIETLAARHDWDYLIGSVHYIAPGWDVDNPKWIGRFTEMPVEEIWALYWKCYEQSIRSRLFDFMAHPDLVKKFGFKPAGDLRRFYEPVIIALAETGTPFEINTAGLRKTVGELYPADEFLKMAAEAGISLLINSDAHSPEEVGAGFDLAATAAREAGFKELVRFEKRTRKMVPL